MFGMFLVIKNTWLYSSGTQASPKVGQGSLHYYATLNTHKPLLSTQKSSSESDRNKEASSLTDVFLSSRAPYFTPLTTSLFFLAANQMWPAEHQSSPLVIRETPDERERERGNGYMTTVMEVL